MGNINVFKLLEIIDKLNKLGIKIDLDKIDFNKIESIIKKTLEKNEGSISLSAILSMLSNKEENKTNTNQPLENVDRTELFLNNINNSFLEEINIIIEKVINENKSSDSFEIYKLINDNILIFINRVKNRIEITDDMIRGIENLKEPYKQKAITEARENMNKILETEENVVEKSNEYIKKLKLYGINIY